VVYFRFITVRITGRTRIIVDTLKYLLTVAVLAWILGRGTEQLGYRWHWHRVPRYLFTFRDGHFTAGPLLLGLAVTFQIAGLGLVCAFVIGLITAIFRLSDSFAARLLARAYLEAIRNTPLLVQLFFIYFVLAPVIDMGAFTAAVLALSLFEGAYTSEILRAGIVSIHKGQWEAAQSLGMSRAQAYIHIVLPQAIRRILPPLTSQGVSLIKDSALVSTISIYDLTMQGRAIISQTFLTFEIWFTVAAIYLVITVSLSTLTQILERRMRIGAA
jgi:polar amino acid transport system permease protein